MARMSGADRRRQILEAATEAMLHRGVALAATRDVTQAIGVGSGLLHHYFPSWADLRAEAVRLTVRREIEDLNVLLSALPAREALDRVADWMIEDEDMRHWRLWLNALDEAHRDPLLAEVMNAAMLDWHRLIAGLFRRVDKEERPKPVDAEAAAWRLAAVMDGLASAMLVMGSVVTPERARDSIRAQVHLELGGRA
ncbi:TetR/AcrR family transcriptional regulator [Algihabitans albus]|uniref:TetR/AcrR family transcriptional regulator n=1 Tax=Algihabitans albus TaxID=2164067 RepID=UPI0013C34551|nr:TetR family transcriptional regulator C-terminal domain-containing protein [Algihabitans albus]